MSILYENFCDNLVHGTSSSRNRMLYFITPCKLPTCLLYKSAAAKDSSKSISGTTSSNFIDVGELILLFNLFNLVLVLVFL